MEKRKTFIVYLLKTLKASQTKTISSLEKNYICRNLFNQLDVRIYHYCTRL